MCKYSPFSTIDNLLDEINRLKDMSSENMAAQYNCDGTEEDRTILIDFCKEEIERIKDNTDHADEEAWAEVNAKELAWERRTGR